MTDKSKVTWIDIDAPKKECTFKELEKESLDETPMQVEKKRKNEKEKEQVLEHTLFRVSVFDGEKIMSGTSVSCAIATGAAALLLEWGIVKSNLPSMNTIMAWSYLIQGCVQQSGFNYPNNQWGYGKLNLLNTFESLKLAPVNINNN